MRSFQRRRPRSPYDLHVDGVTWRDATFDQLALASTEPRWPGYSEYARLQERGLRRDALRVVRQFAIKLRDEPLTARWEFVCWLCDELLKPTVVTDPIVPFPLRTEVVVPTLVEALAMYPEDPRATLWLTSRFSTDLFTLFPGDPEPAVRLLREQLKRTPDAIEPRRLLADLLLGQVEDAAHHLAQSAYLGDPATSRARLSEVRTLLSDPAANVGPDDPLLTETEHQQDLLDAWIEFLSDSSADFPDWCRRHNVEPPGGTSYYFNP